MRLNEQNHRGEYIKMCIHRQSPVNPDTTLSKQQKINSYSQLLIFCCLLMDIKYSAVLYMYWVSKNGFKKAIMIGFGWYCSMIFNTLSV